jgi:hypothetical protein
MVCTYSVASPSYLNCSNFTTELSAAPSFENQGMNDPPTTSPVPKISYIPILLKIKVDAFPNDFKWDIREVRGLVSKISIVIVD